MPDMDEKIRSQVDVAFKEIDDRLELEQRMLQIRPRATHYEQIGELHYLKSKAKRLLLADEDGPSVDYRTDLQAAIEAFEMALTCPASSLDKERRAELEKKLADWRGELSSSRRPKLSAAGGQSGNAPAKLAARS